MDMKNILYFLEISKRKSLSKAAEYLFVSQSTLSQFLAREEQELGVQLFIRNKNELMLTMAGELYEQACKDILSRKETLYKDLSNIAASKTGQITIGITPQWGADMFAEILPVFKSKYPKFLLKSHEDNVKPLVQQLLDGTMDMAVLAIYKEKPIPLDHTVLCKEDFVLAVPNAEKLPASNPRKPDAVQIQAFCKSSFIISCTGTTIRDIQNDILASSRISPNIICEINSMASTLKMVASGLGVSIIPRFYMNGDPRILFYRLTPSWSWDICAVYRRGFTPNEAAEYLTGLIRDYFLGISEKGGYAGGSKN